MDVVAGKPSKIGHKMWWLIGCGIIALALIIIVAFLAVHTQHQRDQNAEELLPSATAGSQ